MGVSGGYSSTWPLQSIDLNPIENIWMTAMRNIGNKVYRNGEGPFVELEKQGNATPKDYIEKLIYSLSNKCSAIINNNGYATK